MFVCISCLNGESEKIIVLYREIYEFAKIWALVVQSIVSLTSSLRGQLVKCFTTL